MLKGEEGWLHAPLLFFLDMQAENRVLVFTVTGT